MQPRFIPLLGASEKQFVSMTKYTQILLLAAACVGGIVLVSVFSKEEASAERDSENVDMGMTDLDGPTIHDEIAAEVVREAGGVIEKDPLHWREIEGFSNELLNLFLEDFVANGGEELQRQYVINMTNEMKLAGNWRAVSAALGNLADAGMVLEEGADSVYSNLLAPEYFAVSNQLHTQRIEYLKWQREKSKGNFPFRKDALLGYPLDFSPEVHFANISGVAEGWDYSTELIQKAAHLRETALRQYSRLALEKFMMSQSLEVALRQISAEVPIGEKEEAMSSAVPRFRRVSEGMDEVGVQYALALAELLSGYSSEIPRAENGE